MKLRSFIKLVATALPAMMLVPVAVPEKCNAALLGTTVLEVRTTGSDTNSGGFVTGSSGTDWSQQNAAQYSVTDAVANGTSTVTSAAGAFGTDVVGNLVYIQGGTGAIAAGWYQIITRNSASSLTLDRSVTTTTGGTLKIGGALDHPSRAQLLNGSLGMEIWVKAGTYNLSSAGAGVYGGRIQTAGSAINATKWEGYNTTRGDIGMTVTSLTRPKLLADTMATSNMMESLGNVTFVGIECDGANKAVSPFTCTSSTTYINCVARNTSGTTGFGPGAARMCLAVSCSTGFSTYQTFGCVAQSCTTQGFLPGYCAVACIDIGSAIGFTLNAEQVFAMNCVAYGGTNWGFSLANSGCTQVINCIAMNRGTKGFNGSGNRNNVISRCAAFGNVGVANDTAAADAWQLDGFITLTADPFTNAAGGDFSLNTTAGGGALLRGLGYPQTFANNVTTSSPNVGASQNSAIVATGASFTFIN